ncbi:MAG TPA: alpha/beta hydrolase-fold protein, partial [Terriglobales bacterium]|nr:alpha/beta hydrolase-fold protein [Terriglobales bacterium]
YPTSGGANKFLDFIETELVPEVDKRYATQPYRIITGHSLGGLFAIHALMNRPQLFQSCIATSPSTWWDDFFVVREAEQFFTKKREFNKTLFFALGDEGGPMGQGFERLKKIFDSAPPKGFVVKSAHYTDELHTSTELRGHYAGLRTIFAGWRVPVDPKTELPAGGLEGVTQHFRRLSERFGFKVSGEKSINSLGYRLLGQKKYDEAIAAFNRNVEWYPQSANVYDSLADGLEGAGKRDEALRNVQKAVELGTKNGDPELPAFQRHLDKLLAASKPAEAKAK